MALYVVVRHPGNPDQRWNNEWLDYSRLVTLETTPEIGRRCELARRRGERIFIHRSGWREHERRVCCSVRVKEVEPGERDSWRVHLDDERLLDETPPRRVGAGTRCYRARPLAGG